MISIDLDKSFSLNELKNVPSTTLAFIGDAYFSLLVRTEMLGECLAKPIKLHKMTTDYVNAKKQSELLMQLLPRLNDNELGVVRRARNAPINTKSKHYGLAEYKKATAFEALLGYLYLENNCDRINELLSGIFTKED